MLRDGTLQQCDTPQVVYDHPLNLFVAAFIGSPAMNLFHGTLSASLETISLGSQQLQLPADVVSQRPGLKAYAGQTIVLGIRPEDLPAASPERSGPILSGEIELIEALGSDLLVHFQTDARTLRTEEATRDPEALHLGGPGGAVADGVARVDPRVPLRPGERVDFSVNTDRLQFFDPQTELAIGN